MAIVPNLLGYFQGRIYNIKVHELEAGFLCITLTPILISLNTVEIPVYRSEFFNILTGINIQMELIAPSLKRGGPEKSIT